MIRTQISLRREQMEALRRLAHERGVSIAALVREAVDRLLTTSRSTAEERAAGPGARWRIRFGRVGRQRAA